ncbi:MAG: DNA-binding protein WhiA [Sporomusaceae bacterium]|jgi:DNA-binding protein WhiA|nr:DNA-binding protein WhiA [Sporomusaceae bacterium]
MVSFSSEVKNELARVFSDSDCCRAAELAALMRMGATLVIGGNKALGVNFSSENAAVARKAVSLIKNGFNLPTEVMVTRGRRLKKNNTYHVRVAPSATVHNLFQTLDIIRDGVFNDAPGSRTSKKACCRRAYLRGAFLGGGSVNKPAGAYHLELVTANLHFAKVLLKFMKAFKLPAGLTERKNAHIVYLKEGDAITSFLQIIGAHNALMAFENVRIVKDMRSRVNRLVNCETANLEKTAKAAAQQIETIKYLEQNLGLKSLSPELKEVAQARLKNPEATLAELSEILQGKISKSGINHRLRKLAEIANNL